MPFISENSPVKEPSVETCVENENQSKTSTRGFFSAIGSKLFSGIQQEPLKKVEFIEAEEKRAEFDEKLEETPDVYLKELRKKTKERKPVVDEPWKRNDRDYLKIKTKYNNSMGNILRTWMSLIYCILILRLHVIKFLQDNLHELNENDMVLQKQLREENLSIYKMIRKAQNFSHERSLSLWIQLEKLIHSKVLIKNALDVVRGRDANRDWKGAALKLSQLEAELENVKKMHQSLSITCYNEQITNLENLNNQKSKEIDDLISQISVLKKKEIQMRGRILINMKNYKELNNKRKQLLSLQREISQVKIVQNSVETDYTDKIQAITNEIEESDKQIKQEKEEIKKLKKNLDFLSCNDSSNPLEA
ncbi:hypothetical protein RUM43_011130 [Polyplax serrata]|uniref:Uncharacterized protein n=1 Tax=Polyplax serrata TaxID=468196 RepID=A0AAN8NSJ5_POLSC